MLLKEESSKRTAPSDKECHTESHKKTTVITWEGWGGSRYEEVSDWIRSHTKVGADLGSVTH